MKANHQIKKRQIGAIAIAMITGTGLILGILLSLLCYQLGMYKDPVSYTHLDVYKRQP